MASPDVPPPRRPAFFQRAVAFLVLFPIASAFAMAGSFPVADARGVVTDGGGVVIEEFLPRPLTILLFGVWAGFMAVIGLCGASLAARACREGEVARGLWWEAAACGGAMAVTIGVVSGGAADGIGTGLAVGTIGGLAWRGLAAACARWA